ncbi:MAG: IPT/TIG domain-containing protein [Syntrophobacteraceae bacterium]
MRSTQAQRILSVLALIAGVILGSAFGANAATINVPDDYATIQAAIDAANDGDTVLVAPGTYVECIEILGKGITVASIAGPEVTIIDGGGKGTVVSFEVCEQKQCSLQGFTLRNGSGELVTAIDIGSSSPIVRGNIIDGNTTWTNRAISGNDSSPVIEKNQFRNFSCTDNPSSGVVYFENASSPIVMDNLFLNNPCRAISFVTISGTSPQIANNTIVGNRSGIGLAYTTDSVLRLYKNNIIVGNNIGFEVQPGTLPSDFIWQNNLVYGNSTNYSGVSDLTGINGNISANPLFLDPANNDFHLCLGSPAIEAGDTTGHDLPATDFDGNPRVIDGQADIGAYEFDPNAPPRVSFEANNVSGTAPLSVQFTSFTTTNVTGYLWDFGDGTSSTEANPSHSFGMGTYTVSLNVIGPTGTGTVTMNNLISSLLAITASAGAGGTISPSGTTTVQNGNPLTYTVTPNPGYQLTALTVDGTTVGGPSPLPLTYTLNNIESDHTVTAVFASYLDYFGIQAGNHFESLATYPKESPQTYTDTISLDTTSFSQPSYLDQEIQDGAQSDIWYQDFSNGLFVKQMESSGTLLTFPQALPLIKTPLAAKAHWAASTSFSVEGIPATAKITATVSPMVLVNVPAGHFLAYPIAYTLSLSARGRTTSQSYTNWFAPYIGTVMAKVISPAETDQLMSFAVGAGTVTTPPPVVTGTAPKSAITGSQISINGFQFGESQGTNTIMIGGINCAQIVSWSDTQIQCIVPETASTGAVTVVTDTWTSNDSIIFTIPPRITSVTPSSGTRGSPVQILGQNFGTVTGKVKLGAVLTKVTQWRDNSTTCTVPAGMPYGACSVTVINSQGQSVLKGAFTVVK